MVNSDKLLEWPHVFRTGSPFFYLISVSFLLLGKAYLSNKNTTELLDFNLQVGDMITSADKGYMFGVIEDYKEYGTSKAWRDNDKSNYITLYHPHSGLFTQYVHLNYKGALVKIGDFVEMGQPIGISKMTGFTTKPHLHFNVKYATTEQGLISTEITFENDVSGSDLKKGNLAKKL